MEIPAGTRIGEYVVERLLGAGGMGSVFLAKHSTTGGEAALKLMHDEAAKQPDLRRRFLREGRATMALDHPNVVRILACFEHQGNPVIAMEVLRGLSLTDYLRQEGKLEVEEIAGIFLRVTSAVGTAHALGLVHRDMKPDNIFLLEEAPFVKVLDFGIAKMRKGMGLDESSALTRTGMLIGTPYYMSPEQAFGDKDIDQRADIWSLGLILYEALMGFLPTRANTLQETFQRMMSHKFARPTDQNQAIPAEVSDLILRMLSRERNDRPFDLREIFEVLSRYAADDTEASGFSAAAAPLMLDEDSQATMVQPAKAPSPMPSVPAQPLKLTPQSLKRPAAMSRDAAVQQQGTVIMADAAPVRPQAPAPPAPADPAPDSIDDALVGTAILPGKALVRETPQAPRRSGVWMWVVAGLLVTVCIVVLATQLR